MHRKLYVDNIDDYKDSGDLHALCCAPGAGAGAAHHGNLGHGPLDADGPIADERGGHGGHV